jgi:preprotein translocase subunit SecY
MRRGIIAASATGAGILALILGLLKPRFTSIVITCLLGAVCVLTGATVLVLAGKPDLWISVLQSAYYPLMAMAVLAVVGVIVQSVRARAEARKADEDQDGKSKKGKPDPGDPAEEQ